MGKLKDAIKNLGAKLNGVEPNGYYVTDLLKSFGTTLTGQNVTGKGLSDILNSIANNYDATAGLINLVPYYSTDVLGKATTDLQTNVNVVANSISGTLNYVTGYTGFSSDEELQSGNYLCLYTPVPADTTVTMELLGGTTGVKTLDDGIIVLRVTSNTQSLRLIATKGDTTVTKVYTFTNLILNETL